MTEFNALRPITQRLTSTPVKELPHIAFFLASSIAACGQALQTTSGQATSRSNDNAVLVHKLKTRVSALLQDRSHEGRFTAVVLVKAIVEAGGREVLSSSSEPWVRGLLAILGRPDSISTKRLCLITITRIFSLTEQYPTLVREITTPLLPAFITACLTLIKPSIVHTDEGNTTVLSPFLEPVFRCFSELLPCHPTVFRPFSARLNTIALSLVGDPSASFHVSDVASSILASLHFSASKNGAGADWVQTCKSIIRSCHMTADQLFRSIIEDWESSEHPEASVPANKNYDNNVQANGPDVLGLETWIGVHDGTQRIVKLLRLLVKFLTQRTAQIVSCPIGSIIDLTARLADIRATEDAKALQFSVRLNAEVARDERDELWMELPNIHIAMLDLLSAVLESFAEAALPIARIALDQTINLFAAEQRNRGLRIAAYRLTEQLLSLFGYSLTKPDVSALTIIVRRCCVDLSSEVAPESLPVNATSTNSNGSKLNGITSIDVDSFAGHQRESLPSRHSRQQEAIYCAAFRLLPCFLSTLPAGSVPHSLRTEIDRTAILIQNRSAMLASVLNPPPTKKGQLAPPSIMPFLARAGSGDLNVEGLLRPRMPVLSGTKVRSNTYADTSEGEDSVKSHPADHSQADETPNPGLADRLDLLNRLNHSLDDSPVDTKQDAEGPDVNRIATAANETHISQSLFENNAKRDLAAMNDEGANYEQDSGIQDVTGLSNTKDSKRRRLEDDLRILDSGDGAITTAVERPGLHESEREVAAKNPSPHVSTQEQPEQGSDTLPNTFHQPVTQAHDSDDESDFEIPEIVDSTSEDDEG